MFDSAEQFTFNCGSFTIYRFEDDILEIKSHMTSHMWLVKKFNDDNYPPMVLYHSHSKNEPYHVHSVYDNDNALLCYVEITNHDKLITKRRDLRNKLTSLSNQQLVRAIFAWKDYMKILHPTLLLSFIFTMLLLSFSLIIKTYVFTLFLIILFWILLFCNLFYPILDFLVYMNSMSKRND